MPRYGSNPKADLAPRECPTCGARFQPYRESQRACSRRCRDRLPDRTAAHREYMARPEVRDRKNASRRVASDPERRSKNLRYAIKRYGITFEMYQQMLAEQDHRCAICSAKPDPAGVKAASRLHVDHDHVTGAVRDLLCNRCNQGIGYFLDDPQQLRAAADYIERHRNI